MTMDMVPIARRTVDALRTEPDLLVRMEAMCRLRKVIDAELREAICESAYQARAQGISAARCSAAAGMPMHRLAVWLNRWADARGLVRVTAQRNTGVLRYRDPDGAERLRTSGSRQS